MSQSPEAVETAVAAQSLLGSQPLTFLFLSDNKSTKSEKKPLSPPSGTKSNFIALQGFNMGYTDDDYELQALQVDLSVSHTDKSALCIATLRDRNENLRRWQGTITALVTFFG